MIDRLSFLKILTLAPLAPWAFEKALKAPPSLGYRHWPVDLADVPIDDGGVRRIHNLFVHGVGPIVMDLQRLESGASPQTIVAMGIGPGHQYGGWVAPLGCEIVLYRHQRLSLQLKPMAPEARVIEVRANA